MDEPALLLSFFSFSFLFWKSFKVNKWLPSLAPVHCIFFSLSLSPSVLLSDAGLNVACVNSARGPVIKENANSLWVARNVVH